MIRAWLWGRMRTRAQRIRYSIIGILLWIVCCVFAFTGRGGWALTFGTLTVAWMVTVLGFMARDHWENRR